ncbi:M48 family metalloprotease [Methylobacterium cerastii]|uniref:M48 family metalloprotease n=1 Tax=Methylobacterium cerastii TaxID=932741 RepID=UPI001EE30CAF|nr:M48 family metallopeptidase [Methylobacterium cerastii]
MLLPFLVMLLGLWEGRRADDDWAAFAAEHRHLSAIVADLEARTPRDGRVDYTLQFRKGGQTYGGPLALDKARDARGEVATMTTLMDWRRSLPPVVVVGGGLAAALSILVLLAGAVLGLVGRTSRDALVGGFSLVRKLLPAALALQIVAATAGFVAAVIFEAGMLAQSGFDGGALKLLGVAAVAVGATVIAAASTLWGLRRALAAFEPDPLPILGRPVSAAEAPGLWRLTEGLADRLGALKPEAVVVGLTGGFFVSAGPALLQPGGERLAGRILYLPLPYLALMRGDEVAAIIGHELAHYAGGDTAYSQRFLPIYAGVGRSLDAVAAGHQGSLGLLGPSLRLGVFVMERFHLAVRHWSRAREFAADAAGAGLTTAEASARALLRTGAVQPRIAETLDAAAEAPASAPSDLVAAVLDRAVAQGLDDPAAHLEAEQAHPTDTHPPTRERVAALGVPLGPDLLALAATAPPAHALGQLGAYFADPAGLCRAATADFLGVVREHEAAVRADLETAAAGVAAEDQVLRDNSRPGAFVLVGAAVLFGLAALGLAIFGFPSLSAREAGYFAVVVLVLGAILGALGGYRLWRGERVTLILRPDGLEVPGLDRSIAWEAIADLDISVNQTGIATRLLLPPEAPFPVRVPGGRGVKLDAKRRIVTFALGLPRRTTPQDFADLLGRYQVAAQARHLLAQAEAARSETRTL